VRIISGKRKGKRLYAPSNLTVRPTTDFAKEALFNILNNNFEFGEITVLDIFSGTGNISYEFASREAIQVTSVDINQSSVKYINNTANILGFEQLKSYQYDAMLYLEKNKNKWDIIFADPPYDFKDTCLIPEIIFKNELLKEDGWLILEHSVQVSFSDNPNLIDQRQYGSVCFSFFRLKNNKTL
jgi:16S rRNA (guanine(966)-N(2))-methyltransferase RsmD